MINESVIYDIENTVIDEIPIPEGLNRLQFYSNAASSIWYHPVTQLKLKRHYMKPLMGGWAALFGIVVPLIIFMMLHVYMGRAYVYNYGFAWVTSLPVYFVLMVMAVRFLSMSLAEGMRLQRNIESGGYGSLFASVQENRELLNAHYWGHLMCGWRVFEETLWFIFFEMLVSKILDVAQSRAFFGIMPDILLQVLLILFGTTVIFALLAWSYGKSRTLVSVVFVIWMVGMLISGLNILYANFYPLGSKINLFELLEVFMGPISMLGFIILNILWAAGAKVNFGGLCRTRRPGVYEPLRKNAWQMEHGGVKDGG